MAQDTAPVVHYGSLDGVVHFPSRSTPESAAESTPEPVEEFILNARLQNGVRYYGHRKINDITEGSEMIQQNLLAHCMNQSPPNQALYDALTAIFQTDAWQKQNAPVDAKLLNNDAIRKKESDGKGKPWYPCQLGCPNGLSETQTGKQGKNTQPGHATTHTEWHLGMHRFECSVCLDTFSRAQPRKDHQKKHFSPGVPCPNQCGVQFTEKKDWNINRHLKYTCPRAQEGQSN